MRIESCFMGKAGLIAVILAMGVGSIQASTMSTFNGPGGVIPDADPSGSPPGVVTSDIVITDPGLICSSTLQPLDCNEANFVTVTIGGLQHPFVGDLIATLTDVTPGISQDLFNRIVKNPIDPSDFGCNCEFNGTYSFSDPSSSFPGDIWTVASGLNAGDTLPSGNYWTTTAGSNTPTSFSAAFGGLPAAGTWRLTISDNSPDVPPDSGSFLGWTLSLDVADTTPVPEPSFATPAGLLGLAFVLFQRRRSAGLPRRDCLPSR
jgi:subtilisin-like proprotein convertase family protein